jgi:hypothetical protein
MLIERQPHLLLRLSESFKAKSPAQATRIRSEHCPGALMYAPTGGQGRRTSRSARERALGSHPRLKSVAILIARRAAGTHTGILTPRLPRPPPPMTARPPRSTVLRMAPLQNPSDANLCFLNSVVQAMRHVKPFSTPMKRARERGPHNHVEYGPARGTCVPCELSALLQALDDEEAMLQHISTQALRNALANVSFDTFGEAGTRADASEAMKFIIAQTHGLLRVDKVAKTRSRGRPRDRGADPQDTECSCPAHEAFGLVSHHKGMCASCGEVVFVPQCSSFTSIFSIALFRSLDGDFETMIAEQSALEPRTCNKCDVARVQVSNHVTKLPKFLVLEIAQGSQPDQQEVFALWSALAPQYLNLKKMLSLDGHWQTCFGRVVSLVCFAHRHYIAYVYNGGQWILYNDTVVRCIGASFDKVVEHGKRSLFAPCLVFYDVLPPYFNVPEFQGSLEGGAMKKQTWVQAVSL